jgi:YHS domain-containing protein
MKRSFIYFALALLVSIGAATAQDQKKRYVNLDRSGLAIKGYDPVAYFTDGKAVKGEAGIAAQYLGATYYFASARNKTAFEKEPAKYEPQFGGFCGYAVSQGHTASVDPEAFLIQDGRLILQYSKKVLASWNENPNERLKSADANWPGIAAKKGK